MKRFLALNGPFVDEVVSHYKRCLFTSVTLDIRTTDTVEVSVEYNGVIKSYIGFDTQSLLKLYGMYVKLRVRGTANGYVELVV